MRGGEVEADVRWMNGDHSGDTSRELKHAPGKEQRDEDEQICS